MVEENQTVLIGICAMYLRRRENVYKIGPKVCRLNESENKMVFTDTDFGDSAIIKKIR